MLSDYQTLVPRLARDDAARLVSGDIDDAITHAVRRYSKDRPKLKVEDVTPASSQLLPLPASWEADFSELASLEHPIGDVPPSLIENDRYGFYVSPTVTKIQLIDGVAVAANSVRATFNIKHVVSGAADTIPLQDRETVACWAAALLCDQLAALFSSGTDSTMRADSAPGPSRAQEYSARARTLRKRYLDELGIEEKRAVAAGTVVDLHSHDSLGQDRLMHPARFR